MTGPRHPDAEQEEIDADRRSEWWLVLHMVLAVALVAVLVVLGSRYGVG